MVSKNSSSQKSNGFPGLSIGQILTNKDLVQIFKCSVRGTVRRSLKTNSLVWIYHPPICRAEIASDIIHFPVSDLVNDPYSIVNITNKISVKFFLFEAFARGQYVYFGQVELAGTPYQISRPDFKGVMRKNWVYPLRRIKTEKTCKVPPIISKTQEIKEDTSKRGRHSKRDD